MIVVYRTVIMFSVLLFIFTDIYVRHKAIGAYLVFLFVLQITPAFMARTNWLQFLIIGVLTVVEYIFFVSKTLNTLFATLIIFVCFAITTDYLRKYFIKQLKIVIWRKTATGNIEIYPGIRSWHWQRQSKQRIPIPRVILKE